MKIEPFFNFIGTALEKVADEIPMLWFRFLEWSSIIGILAVLHLSVEDATHKNLFKVAMHISLFMMLLYFEYKALKLFDLYKGNSLLIFLSLVLLSLILALLLFPKVFEYLTIIAAGFGALSAH